MNIENLTFGEMKKIAEIFNGIGKSQNQEATFTPHIGKRCIVRTYASGVFCAEVVAQSGRMVELKNCRRLWSWKAADGISLSAVAVNGVDPSKCRFPVATESQTVLDALEIIPATDKALRSIDSCGEAKAS